MKKQIEEKMNALIEEYERINQQKQKMVSALNNYNEKLSQLNGGIIVIKEILASEEKKPTKRLEGKKTDEIQNSGASKEKI